MRTVRRRDGFDYVASGACLSGEDPLAGPLWQVSASATLATAAIVLAAVVPVLLVTTPPEASVPSPGEAPQQAPSPRAGDSLSRVTVAAAALAVVAWVWVYGTSAATHAVVSAAFAARSGSPEGLATSLGQGLQGPLVTRDPAVALGSVLFVLVVVVMVCVHLAHPGNSKDSD